MGEEQCTDAGCEFANGACAEITVVGKVCTDHTEEEQCTDAGCEFANGACAEITVVEKDDGNTEKQDNEDNQEEDQDANVCAAHATKEDCEADTTNKCKFMNEKCSDAGKLTISLFMALLLVFR